MAAYQNRSSPTDSARQENILYLTLPEAGDYFVVTAQKRHQITDAQRISNDDPQSFADGQRSRHSNKGRDDVPPHGCLLGHEPTRATRRSDNEELHWVLC